MHKSTNNSGASCCASNRHYNCDLQDKTITTYTRRGACLARSIKLLSGTALGMAGNLIAYCNFGNASRSSTYLSTLYDGVSKAGSASLYMLVNKVPELVISSLPCLSKREWLKITGLIPIISASITAASLYTVQNYVVDEHSPLQQIPWKDVIIDGCLIPLVTDQVIATLSHLKSLKEASIKSGKTKEEEQAKGKTKKANEKANTTNETNKTDTSKTSLCSRLRCCSKKPVDASPTNGTSHVTAQPTEPPPRAKTTPFPSSHNPFRAVADADRKVKEAEDAKQSNAGSPAVGSSPAPATPSPAADDGKAAGAAAPAPAPAPTPGPGDGAAPAKKPKQPKVVRFAADDAKEPAGAPEAPAASAAAAAAAGLNSQNVEQIAEAVVAVLKRSGSHPNIHFDEPRLPPADGAGAASRQPPYLGPAADRKKQREPSAQRSAALAAPHQIHLHYLPAIASAPAVDADLPDAEPIVDAAPPAAVIVPPAPAPAAVIALPAPAEAAGPAAAAS